MSKTAGVAPSGEVPGRARIVRGEARRMERSFIMAGWFLMEIGFGLDWTGGLRATMYGARKNVGNYIYTGEKTKTRKDLAFSVSYSAVSDSQSQIHSKTATLSKGFDHHHNIDVTLKEREYYVFEAHI